MEVWFKVILMLLAMAGACNCQEFAFFRCNNLTKALQFVYFSRDTNPVYDIFAQSRMSTCSLRAGVVTGQGRSSDPFVLEIDLSQGLVGQSPDCGVTQAADDTVQVQMVVQRSCAAVTSGDLRSTSSCRMTIPDSRPAQENGTATYSCQPPSTIVFQFSRPAPDTAAPSDIYAVGRRASCSRTAAVGAGQGLALDPFVIRMDATNVKTNCGVQRVADGVYNVTMYVQQFDLLITSSDISYLLTCNFTSSATQTLETIVVPSTSNAPVHAATPTLPSSSLSVTSEAGGVSMTSLVVGEQIRLVAQLLDGPASGVRLTSCEARPGPGLQPRIQVLGADGCSTPPTIVPPFIGQSPVGRVAMTNLFRAFKFDQSDTVYFKCQVTFCYDTDLTCLGSHCQGQGQGQVRRRRRDTSERHNHTLVVVIRVLDLGNSSQYSDTGSRKLETVTLETEHDAYDSSPDHVLGWPVSALVVVSCLSGIAALSCGLAAWAVCRLSNVPKGAAER